MSNLSRRRYWSTKPSEEKKSLYCIWECDCGEWFSEPAWSAFCGKCKRFARPVNAPTDCPSPVDEGRHERP